jgi:hypothetical protein
LQLLSAVFIGPFGSVVLPLKEDRKRGSDVTVLWRNNEEAELDAIVCLADQPISDPYVIRKVVGADRVRLVGGRA